jgi:hypothetical protein
MNHDRAPTCLPLRSDGSPSKLCSELVRSVWRAASHSITVTLASLHPAHISMRDDLDPAFTHQMCVCVYIIIIIFTQAS